jgi:oxygen-independent coproporphyrinogen-3 oxidase
VKHLYIHIPFCHRRCSYCDFNTYANMEDRMEAYVQALCRELSMLAADTAPGQPTSEEAAALRPTIFIGGGTPTMLSLDQFARVLQAADALVSLADAEVTSEANPGTVLDRTYLHGLRRLGVNRLSMGVQSLHDPTLRVLGRIHTAAEARRSYHDARSAGFDSINLDFIFGLPGQEQAQWAATLREVVAWGVDHFSLYSLILEEDTPLALQVVNGQVAVPDDDATAAMYEEAIEQFGRAGYVHYEISNWARPYPQAAAPAAAPARVCEHNLAYWLNSDYYAAGAGAHGHIYPQRYANLRGIDRYIAALDRNERPIAESTILNQHDLAAETMMMGLRLTNGVSEQHFAARCGRPLKAVYGTTIDRLTEQGLLETTVGRVRLTQRGRMLGNRVFAEFV